MKCELPVSKFCTIQTQKTTIVETNCVISYLDKGIVNCLTLIKQPASVCTSTLEEKSQIKQVAVSVSLFLHLTNAVAMVLTVCRLHSFCVAA